MPWTRLSTDDTLELAGYALITLGLRSAFGQDHPFGGPMPLTFYLPWLAFFGGLAVAGWLALRAHRAAE